MLNHNLTKKILPHYLRFVIFKSTLCIYQFLNFLCIFQFCILNLNTSFNNYNLNIKQNCTLFYDLKTSKKYLFFGILLKIIQ